MEWNGSDLYQIMENWSRFVFLLLVVRNVRIRIRAQVVGRAFRLVRDHLACVGTTLIVAVDDQIFVFGVLVSEEEPKVVYGEQRRWHDEVLILRQY